MASEILKKYEAEFTKILHHVREELMKIRTGRAKSSLVEDIMVEVYGARMRVRELAHVSVPEPNTLLVKVWDRSIIKEVEKALLQVDLGFNASIEGEMVRLKLPDLTQERREQLVKFLHEKSEKDRVAARLLRDKVREEIQGSEKEGKISEDEKFRSLKDLDQKTKEYVDKINVLGQEKEKEILGI